MKTWAAVSDNTAPFSAVGAPALQVPCGFTKAGLPVGLQIAGRWGDEARLFRIGGALEAETELWRAAPPEISGQPPPEALPEARAEAPPAPPDARLDEAARRVLHAAESMGYAVRRERLADLARGAAGALAGLKALDELNLHGCERAETLNLLDMDLDAVPKP